MLRIKLFDGVEKELKVFNRQAVLDYDILFFTEDCDDDLEEEETDFTFPSYLSSYLRVYNERTGRLIKTIALSQSAGSLIINASVSEMTFTDLGVYWYEIGYVQGGGYEVVLMYGKMTVV